MARGTAEDLMQLVTCPWRIWRIQPKGRVKVRKVYTKLRADLILRPPPHRSTSKRQDSSIFFFYFETPTNKNISLMFSVHFSNFDSPLTLILKLRADLILRPPPHRSTSKRQDSSIFFFYFETPTNKNISLMFSVHFSNFDSPLTLILIPWYN